ncbi:MAG: hypothetical protein BGO56_10970 [Sphingobacteriales bacterium 48-107]|nr:MAG: hypothetical protein BGO56_10970 [Sphingobacteriales bacterium 48-107]
MLGQAAPVLSFKRSDYRGNLTGNRIKWLILQGFKELVLGRRYGKVRWVLEHFCNFRIMK